MIGAPGVESIQSRVAVPVAALGNAVSTGPSAGSPPMTVA